MNKKLIQHLNLLIDRNKDSTASGYMFNSKDAELRYFLHNHDRYLHTFNLLEKYINRKSRNIKILDIGTSPFTFLLKKIFPQSQVWTIDYDNQFKSRCAKFGIKFIKLDLSSPKKTLPKNEFDIVTYLEVIEHLTQGHKNSLQNVIEALREGGVCILQTPNKNSLKTFVLKFNPLKKLWGGRTISFDFPSQFLHHREFAKSELEKMIRSIDKAQIISSSYGSYYDTVASASAYRKSTVFLRGVLHIYSLFVKPIPFLRADIEIVFSKSS